MKGKIYGLCALLIVIGTLGFFAVPLLEASSSAAIPGGCQGVTEQPATLPGAQSVVYSNTDKRELRLHIFQPAVSAQAHPAIMFFFGGSWRVGTIKAFERQAKAFTELGYVTVLADYRVKCRDGSNPLESLDDAEAAYAWLRVQAPAYNIDPQRLVLAGGSAGGQLALATAMRAAEDEKPAGLLLFNPAVDLVTPAPFYLKLIARRISPSVLSTRHLPPLVLFHGQADRTVPIQTVRDFCQRAVADRAVCELHEYPGLGHSFFHSTAPYGSTTPFDDTLNKAISFLDAQGISPSHYRVP